MILHVIGAEYRDGYRIWLKFNDGAEGIVDLKDDLYGEVFEPLKDPALFKAFGVDQEIDTLVWENAADLAPEFLRDHLSV